jgi:protein subunit release factor A
VNVWGITFQGEDSMVEIKEVPDGVLVEGTHYRETFRNRFKAIMAARAIALGQSAECGRAVTIRVPTSWGDPVIIEAPPSS